MVDSSFSFSLHRKIIAVMGSQANRNHKEQSETLNEIFEEVTNEELRDIWLNSCEALAKSDEDLRILINKSADISTVDRFSEERRRLKSMHRKIKKIVKAAYREYSWKSTSPLSISAQLNNSNVKPSFIVQNDFRDVDSTIEFLSKFGTLSYCRNITMNKVKLAFYYMEDAVAALNHPKHPRGVSFYADPFPEIGVRLVRNKELQRKRSRDQSPRRSVKQFRSQTPVCVTITDKEEEEQQQIPDYDSMAELEKEEYLRQNGIYTIPEINLYSDEEEEKKEKSEIDLFSDDSEEGESRQSD